MNAPVKISARIKHLKSLPQTEETKIRIDELHNVQQMLILDMFCSCARPWGIQGGCAVCGKIIKVG